MTCTPYHVSSCCDITMDRVELETCSLNYSHSSLQLAPARLKGCSGVARLPPVDYLVCAMSNVWKALLLFALL